LARIAVTAANNAESKDQKIQFIAFMVRLVYARCLEWDLP
jgi:hypothetical protein